MKKGLIHLLAMLFAVSISSCAYKTCATYGFEDTKNLKVEKTMSVTMGNSNFSSSRITTFSFEK